MHNRLCYLISACLAKPPPLHMNFLSALEHSLELSQIFPNNTDYECIHTLSWANRLCLYLGWAGSPISVTIVCSLDFICTFAIKSSLARFINLYNLTPCPHSLQMVPCPTQINNRLRSHIAVFPIDLIISIKTHGASLGGIGVMHLVYSYCVLAGLVPSLRPQ